MPRTSIPLPAARTSWRPLALALTLTAGCAGPGWGPSKPAAAAPTSPLASVAGHLPMKWHAAAPPTEATPDAPAVHAADALALQGWFEGSDDPLIGRLIAAAQAVGGDIAQARARVAQAEAARVAAAAELAPQLGAGAGLQRGVDPAAGSTRPASALNVALQGKWNLDLFGAGRAASEAAHLRALAATLGRTAAAQAVATETAATYVQLRACEREVAQREVDAASRAETARLSELTARAGFLAPAAAALASAGAAQSRAARGQQAAQCQVLMQSLAVLTGWTHDELRRELAPRTARLPQLPTIIPDVLPGQLLARRPDLALAALEVEAAEADERQALAARWPQVSVSGSLGRMFARTAQGSWEGRTWTLGPLAISLPILDGGRIEARQQASQAAREAALTVWEARWRAAVGDAEKARIQLVALAEREADVRAAERGYAVALRAAEALQRGGLGSMLELEDARRSANNAAAALVALDRERLLAWIQLQQALGGGFELSPAWRERFERIASTRPAAANPVPVERSPLAAEPPPPPLSASAPDRR